jgi:beta-galactosidase/beta-glucuronidase
LFAPGGQEVMQFAAHRFNYRDSTYAEVRRGRQLSQGNTIVLQGRLPAPKRWSPARPGHVYTLQIEQQDTAGHWYKRRYRFAFKTFRTRAGHFLLNGEEVLLKGINRHEDHPAHGPVYNDSVLQADTRQMRRMGANFCRPGHYPNALHSLRTMEQQGLMLMEELPLYQLTGRQMRNEQLQALARRALRQLIIRDYNRPGVVMWSLANELYNWTPAAKRLLRQLHRIAKRMDPRRETHVAKVSLPLLVDRLLPDNSSAIPDVTGANLYFGWYLGTTDKATPYLRRLHRQWPEQPLLVSEFGAGALHGRRLAHPPGEEPNKQHSYSEEFQAYFLRQHLRQYRELPFIHGAMPWVWADFRMQWSPNTGTPHPKPLWNLKGLLSGDRRKKLGYRAVKSFYDQWRP